LPQGNLFCLIYEKSSDYPGILKSAMNKTTHTLMTQQELLELPQDGMRHELIKGELTTMTPAGSEYGESAAWICRILGTHIVNNGLGRSFGTETGFIIERDPDTVRAPDFAFISKSRNKSRTPKGFFAGAPDLAVEVLSPHDRAVEMEDKIQQWLDAGCVCVWIVNPTRRTITIHKRNSQPQVLSAADEINPGDVLPGFSAKVQDLFPPADEA
jgi:Uma2 family endonuclease